MTNDQKITSNIYKLEKLNILFHFCWVGEGNPNSIYDIVNQIVKKLSAARLVRNSDVILQKEERKKAEVYPDVSLTQAIT